MLRRLALPTALLTIAAPLTACGGDSDAGGEKDTTLTVYAAASLTTAFTEIGKRFESDNDGVKVEFDFAGSSDLAAQIEQGAPADVFASADTANMDKVADQQDGEPKIFATNTLEIAVPPGNPAGIASFADLADSDAKVVVCAPEVPCGAAAAKVEQAAGVILKPVSEEQSVTDVLAKVASGEADAGLVYVTDVLAAGDDVEGVTFPESDQAVNSYPVVALTGADDQVLARRFAAALLTDEGQMVLEDAGFAAP